jgi:large subunit ribosomal protein L21
VWAIIETGGKQYRVEKSDRLAVEKLAGEIGSNVTFDRVLLLGKKSEEILLGKPYLEKARVQAKILENRKNKKVLVFKYKPKKRYRIKRGHRQEQTVMEITDIQG